MQAKKELEEYLDNPLPNKLFSSNVPQICKSEPCILGIDEAGRGPVLGPMVYAVAYYPEKLEQTLAQMKFADSKQLTEANREKLFEALQGSDNDFKNLGYAIKILSPNMISNCMLRRSKYNLNLMSHDTAIELIRTVESHGIKIAQVFIDTVGPAISYKEKLQRHFKNYIFTVAEKADSKYPIVSAASVCAKVMRDRIINNWKYPECASLHLDAYELGSGYPGDPGTKKFLETCLDPVFGFPTLTRFSWSTITKILDKKGSKCDWNDDNDEEDPKVLFKQRAMFKSYFKKPAPAKAAASLIKAAATKAIAASTKSRTNADIFFEDRGLSRVMQW